MVPKAGPSPAKQGAPQTSLAGIPSDWWGQVQADIQKEEYNITWQEASGLPEDQAGYQAPNRAQRFRTWFTAEGIRVVPRDPEMEKWEWGLALVGEEAGSWKPEAGEKQKPGIRVSDNRIEYDRGWITEWYVNSPEGLEQGFTIPGPLQEVGSWWSGGDILRGYLEPSSGPREGKLEVGGGGDSELRTPISELRIDMTLSGNLHPKFSDDGQAVDFYDNNNFNVIHYAELKVADATGRVLPARFEGWVGAPNSEHRTPDYGGGIRIVIDVEGAVYPITVDPLATTPAWMAEGNQVEAFFSYSVGTAGDVNGDGYSDIIVGAYSYDNGQTDEGRAFVYLGGAAGPAASAGWTAESDQAGALFGASVGAAGDVNGDGYSDIIVGAFQYDNGQADEGRAYVYLGGAGGPAASAGWTAEIDQAAAYFGYAVGTAGDVDGDGYSDVVVGAYSYDNGQTDEGRAFVYLGGAAGPAASAGWTAESDQTGACFGLAVGTAGDVNGDGHSDVIVGAYAYDNGQTDEGRAYVYLGSPSGPQSSAGWTGESDQAGAFFGYSVGTAGDVNGDGYSDVVVGAYFYDNGQTDEGRAYVYLGGAAGPASSAGWTAESDQAGARFGRSVGTAGDVNGDGYSDIIVGAVYFDNGQSDEGRAFVYLGGAAGPAASAGWTAESDQAGADFGLSVGTAGDVNGDGYSDIIVGAPYYDNGQTNEGRAYVYLGGPGGPAAEAGWMKGSDQGGGYFGCSVGTAGDVNGDGYADVIIGANWYDNGQSNEGRAYVFQGSAAGLGTAPSWTAEADQATAYFGSAVGTAGDVNGDGFSDVIIGSYYYDNGLMDEGAAFVWLGSASGLGASGTPTNADWMAEGDQSSACFGWSVGTAGDVNGDGYADVIIGVTQYDNGQSNEGRALVYHGSVGGLGTGPAWSAEPDLGTTFFGSSVGTAGDVNGDGYSDVIIGAEGYTNPLSLEGAAFVYHGSAAGLAAAPAWVAEGDQAGARFGESVATAGDVNGDGYADIIVGAYYYDGGQTDEGRVLVYHGSEAGLLPNPSWGVESDQAGAQMGDSAATAGDVNGDGYADVVVGASRYTQDSTWQGRAFVYLGSPAGLSAGPVWWAEVNQTGAYLGNSVGTAGDVNGDGYADVLIGAYRLAGYGWTFLYYGNNGPGASLMPQQRRADDAAPVAHLGTTDDTNAFLAALVGRTPFGRGKFKIEWEVKPLGTPFSGTGTGLTAEWQDTGASGVLHKELVDGLSADTVHHWRARLLYHPATTPFQQASRWVTVPWDGWQEADLRTAAPACDPPVLAVFITGATKDGTGNTLIFEDPNGLNQRSGWNVRRTDDAALSPQSDWPLEGSDVTDGDPGTPATIEWTDTDGNPPAGTAWFYQVTAFNRWCPVEGPF